MDEKIYMDEGKVLVTSTRIDIDGQTFAVRNIGSVKVLKPEWPIMWGLLTFVTIFVAVVAESRLWYAAVVVFFLLAVAKASTHRLVLVSGGGEQVAVTSTNGPHVEKIRQAVARAISVR